MPSVAPRRRVAPAAGAVTLTLPLGNVYRSGNPGRDARLPFQRIGAYEIDQLIGRGGMASVYRVHLAGDGARRAAVKVLHPHLVGDGKTAERFVREARTLSRIAHPNVVGVLEVGDAENQPYFVMPLVDGDDLAGYLQRFHPMSVRQIADCLLPVIDAVATVHATGIVHRDLKPRNIRFAHDGAGKLTPKVLDFGVSKWIAPGSLTDLTETGETPGTLAYMAPEQLRSARRVDALCDVYSLGVILYECAVGRRPFHGATSYELMHNILTADVAPPSFLRQDLPPAFDSVVHRAMHRETSQRFESARDLQRALADCASHVDVSERESAGTGAFTYRPRTARTVACRTVRAGDLRVAVWLHTREDPSQTEWTDTCQLVAELVQSKGGDLGSYRGFVVTDGGAPDTMQRKQLFSDVHRGHRHKVAVVTTILRTSLVKRGIATAVHWLNPETRFFEPRDIERALAHIDVSPDHVGALWKALSSMQTAFPPNETLRSLADVMG